MLNETNIVAPRVPLIDERTGLISREWYRFFLNLFVLTGSGANVTSLLDLQVGPPAVTVDEFSRTITKISENLSPSQDGLLAQIAEMQKQIQALEIQRQPEIELSAFTQNDVQFTDLSDGDLIDYNATLGYWQNAPATSVQVVSWLGL